MAGSETIIPVVRHNSSGWRQVILGIDFGSDTNRVGGEYQHAATAFGRRTLSEQELVEREQSVAISVSNTHEMHQQGTVTVVRWWGESAVQVENVSEA